MAEASLRLEIATPHGLALQETVDEVVIPGSMGELGVLPGHTPVLSTVKPGVLNYRRGGKVYRIAVDAGFVEIKPELVLVLCAHVALPETVEPAKVNKEREAAEKELFAFADLREGELFEKLSANVGWAEAQLELKAQYDRDVHI